MTHQGVRIKARSRYVGKELQKIEAEALENARTLGFTTLVGLKREYNRLKKIAQQNFQKLPTGGPERLAALSGIVKALDVEALLDELREADKWARVWIERERETIEKESRPRIAKAA
jgi:hypothetical protein